MNSFEGEATAPWVIDEEDVFGVNENLKIDTLEVGHERTRVVVVDNFYKRPDRVRQVAMRAPSSRWEQLVRNYPGFARPYLLLNSYVFMHPIARILGEVYGVALRPGSDRQPFMANILLKSTQEGGVGTCSRPHADESVDFGCLIYLNLPAECEGGTAFYRHKRTGRESRPIGGESLAGATANSSTYFTDSDDEWERIQLVEMAFNRLVLYPAGVYHSPYIEPQFFRDAYRINQVLFIKTVTVQELLAADPVKGSIDIPL